MQKDHRFISIAYSAIFHQIVPCCSICHHLKYRHLKYWIKRLPKSENFIRISTSHWYAYIVPRSNSAFLFRVLQIYFSSYKLIFHLCNSFPHVCMYVHVFMYLNIYVYVCEYKELIFIFKNSMFLYFPSFPKNKLTFLKWF